MATIHFELVASLQDRVASIKVILGVLSASSWERILIINTSNNISISQIINFIIELLWNKFQHATGSTLCYKSIYRYSNYGFEFVCSSWEIHFVLMTPTASLSHWLGDEFQTATWKHLTCQKNCFNFDITYWFPRVPYKNAKLLVKTVRPATLKAPIVKNIRKLQYNFGYCTIFCSTNSWSKTLFSSMYCWFYRGPTHSRKAIWNFTVTGLMALRYIGSIILLG